MISLRSVGNDSRQAPSPSRTRTTAWIRPTSTWASNEISWCIRGDNTPEYADYLGCLDFWEMFPKFPKGKSLEVFYEEALG
jgi:hypothetical protein